MNSSEIGHIDHHTLNDAWNSERMQEVRRQVAAGKYQEAGCSPNCSYFQTPQEQRGNYNTALRSIWEKVDPDKKTYHDNIALLLEGHRRSSCTIASFPVFFDIQPTEACNMNCIMCHQKHQTAAIIPAEKLMKLFAHLEVVHTIRFQGGEVFLDKDFPAAVASLQHRMHPFQRIQIITNGSLLTQTIIHDLTGGPNPVRFIVSIDATEPDVFKKIRRSPHFSQVWDNLLTLAARQKASGKTDLVEWNFVVMKTNFFQIKDAIQKAADLAVSIRFNPIIGDYPGENIFNFPDIVPEKAAEYLEGCLQFVRSCKARVNNLEQLPHKLAMCK